MSKQYILKQITKRNVALAVLLLIVFSFALERLTLPVTTEDMERRATEYGTIHKKERPPKPFVYDGCTFFIDSLLSNSFSGACFRHDVAYWYGGTDSERKEADAMLAQDIKESGMFGNLLSYPVYISVRLFGDTILTRSVNAHWGFGWE